jgi:predicted NUDIX family NTP pyrophosphohydrolase
MKKKSAGILLYRFRKRDEEPELEVLIVHPGGPFWANKDLGVWSIPKGELGEGEDPLLAAKREFREETGFDVNGHFYPLGTIIQKGGKEVTVFAVEGDLDITRISSNEIAIDWPPRSGKKRMIPEIDKGAWVNIMEAKQKLLEAQSVLPERLQALLEHKN